MEDTKPLLTPASEPPAAVPPSRTPHPLPTDEKRQIGGKGLLVFFLLLVLALVGVRVGADAKARAVPFPNFMASSKDRVAVSWGQEVLLLDVQGKVLGKENLPPDVELTQLKFVGDELWLGNFRTKSIQRLRDNKLETVVNAGARIGGTFKFAVDSDAGEIFVTDANNHRVHVFSTAGSYLRTFGVEGKGAGELKFPNTIVFDGDGNLLIVNTNAHRIDRFSRDGRFLATFAQVTPVDAPIYSFSYPTLLTQIGDKVAFLLTYDLRKARAVVYGNNGEQVGELPTPKPLLESGDIAAVGDNVVITENQDRKIYLFSGQDYSYLGPFSRELDARGEQATAQEQQYKQVASLSLWALLLSCIPVVFIYYRFRTNQRQSDENYASFIPASALCYSRVDRYKVAAASFLGVFWLLLLVLRVDFGLNHPGSAAFRVASAVLLGLLARVVVITGGVGSISRKGVLERHLKAASVKLAALLTDGEQVELCALVQRGRTATKPALVLMTDRRIVLVDFKLSRLVGFKQFGYGDVRSVTAQPVPRSKGSVPLLDPLFFKLCIILRPEHGVPVLQLVARDSEVVERVREKIEALATRGPSLGYAALCDNCLRPAPQGGCPTCAMKTKDRRPLILSLVYPGLGQLYNRQMSKGAWFLCLFTFGWISLTKPVIQLLDRSAETRPIDLALLACAALVLLLIYVRSAIDANRVAGKTTAL